MIPLVRFAEAFPSHTALIATIHNKGHWLVFTFTSYYHLLFWMRTW